MRVTIQKEKVLIREFAHRDDIRVLVIPAECKKIEYKAFSNCKNLAQVIVESGADKLAIEFDAFKGCDNMVIFETFRPIYFFKDVNLRRTNHDRRKYQT